jgi:hypothetical protein
VITISRSPLVAARSAFVGSPSGWVIVVATRWYSRRGFSYRGVLFTARAI